jgi:spore coat protein U-like protein
MLRIHIGLPVAAALGAILLAAGPAAAKTATTTFQVTASVPSSCALSATDLSFGNIPANVSTAIDATSVVTITCTNTTPYSIALNAGTATGATVATRQMQNGSNLLSYALYSNSSRTTIWGDGTSGSTAVSGTGTGEAQAHTLYGRIATNQNDVAAGSFLDTITATVTY